MTDASSCHETVDPDTRAAMLEKHQYRCQTCGRCGPQAGGLATLHVHHLSRDPDGMGENDEANLTVLCRGCHSWQHQQTTRDDVPVHITDEDLTVLYPQDIDILRVLADSGPLSASDITAELTADRSVTTVREHLWMLMGLDTLVETRDRQVVDQDAETGEWGLVGQIERSSRARIPSDPQVLLQRIEDEFVRQALDRGCDRDAVMAVLDVSRRGTFYKEKRARAFDFPLDAIDRRGGRPPADEDSETTGDAVSTSANAETSADDDDPQQRLGAVRDETVNRAAEAGEDGEPSAEYSDGQSGEAGQAAAREHVQEAIAALQALNAAL